MRNSHAGGGVAGFLGPNTNDTSVGLSRLTRVGTERNAYCTPGLTVRCTTQPFLVWLDRGELKRAR